jgi:tetratricopeptide (TPR) repeat protein
MEHATLLQDLLIYPQLRAEQRLGYEFVYRTIQGFLDAYVKGDSSGLGFIARSAVQNGFPAGLVKTELKLPALPAIPTAEEVEQIAMTGNVERLRTMFRQARAGDPQVRMFALDDLNLFAFRFGQRGERETALGFGELAVEAFPGSALAANSLGNAYRDAGRMERALELWEKALTLLDGDSDIAPTEKAQSRAAIQQKIQQARTARR